MIFLISGFSWAQTKIDKSKRELTEESAVTNTEAKRVTSEDDEPSLFWAFFGGVIVKGISWTFIGNYENEGHLSSKLTPYPFYDRVSGNFESPDIIVGVGGSPKNRFRIDIEDSYLYNSKQLNGNYLEVKIRPFQYFYL